MLLNSTNSLVVAVDKIEVHDPRENVVPVAPRQRTLHEITEENKGSFTASQDFNKEAFMNRLRDIKNNHQVPRETLRNSMAEDLKNQQPGELISPSRNF